jgi:lysophospholipase L1-like esterase
MRTRPLLRPAGALCLLVALAVEAAAAESGSRPTRLPPFELRRGDVVVFTGGANVVAEQHLAFLETLLTLAQRERAVRFRNMAWEGDTVYEQRRDLNFGSWTQQLQRVGATVLFAQFGQMEALAGRAAVPRFIGAYEKLIEEFSRQTPRIILLSPLPFERAEPPLPDLSRHNQDLAHSVEAIRELANRRGLKFVDLFTPLRRAEKAPAHLTSDGVHLTAFGHLTVASLAARQLGLVEVAGQVNFDPANEKLSPEPVERLREAIRRKNRCWFDYWRPMNWAFLHGDRTEQPSSRDHRDPKVRWFPAEMEKFLELIDAEEARISILAKEAATIP